MRHVAYAFWYLPPGPGRRRPYASRFKMTAEEAAQSGAIEMVPGSIEYREVPETEAERAAAQVRYQSAGRDSVQPPKA